MKLVDFILYIKNYCSLKDVIYKFDLCLPLMTFALHKIVQHIVHRMKLLINLYYTSRQLKQKLKKSQIYGRTKSTLWGDQGLSGKELLRREL